MLWARRGALCTDVEEAVQALSGRTLDELKHPAPCPPEGINGLENAAEVIMQAALDARPAVIIGDYDADGITATAILSKLLTAIGVRHTTIVPRRVTDGYGVSDKHVQDLHDSLIITVDNGISAGRILDACVERRNTVVVIDHHLPGDTPPTLAAAVVDPHLSPSENEFLDYCGAGLAYKLATFILRKSPVSPKLRNDILLLAGIGTVGDSMPLVGDNRVIVCNMLELANDHFAPMSHGLRQLLLMCEEPGFISTSTVAFKIAPLINAPGRLYDAGGSSSLKMLLCDDEEESRGYAAKMDAINKKRRSIVDMHMPTVCSIVQGQVAPFVVYLPDLPEGILGIVAGKVLSTFGGTAIALTDSNVVGEVKGSVRASADVHAKDLLSSVSEYLISYGGHAGAAALKLKKEDVQCFTDAVCAYRSDTPRGGHLYYDVDLMPMDVAPSMSKLNEMEPLGHGVPAPICLVSNVEVQEVVYMGAEKNHVKFVCDGFCVVGFNKAELYRKQGEPQRIEVVGTLSENHFRGNTTVQIIAEDFRPCVF